MDRIDRKILDILQKDARAPLKEIADRVFLSSPAVSARMARLESSGAIMSYQAQVAAPMLGYMVKAFINLDMDPQRKPEFYPYIESCPHVVECNCVTGDYSMLIEVLFATTQELDQFINHLQQFGRTRTQIVFSTPVEHRGVPVAESVWRKMPPILRNNRRPGGCSGFPAPWIRPGLHPRGACHPRGCGPRAPAGGAYPGYGSARSK